MNPQRHAFLLFCSDVTGYSCFELEATGLVDSYHAFLDAVLGSRGREFNALVEAIARLPDAAQREAKIQAALLPPSPHWPVVSRLISLWYLGLWTQLPDSWYQESGQPLPGPEALGRTHVPSSLAYIEQLSYRTAHAHPPGAGPPGFGSWSEAPVIDRAILQELNPGAVDTSGKVS